MLEIKVQRDNRKTLLELLREQNNYLPAVCAGRGTCGKCRVRIIKGEAAVAEADRSFFSDAQLQQGWRLACKCVPTEDLILELGEDDEGEIEVLGMGGEKAASQSISEAQKNLILGIDIGTTTIAMALRDEESGRTLEEYLCLNRQRMYGADVVSRIQASVEGKDRELQNLVRADLWKGICSLTRNGQFLPRRIVIAANTTMIHLLVGYPCKGLGQYPFTPYHIGEITGEAEEILGSVRDLQDECKAPVCPNEALDKVQTFVIPGISAFVGADIVADMLVCGMAEQDEVCMLIDIGTNGEMAIGNRDRILVTSTAAGPAFEGGNISCGTGSIPGAICGVELGVDGGLCLRTIQDCPPVGICGTGTIEILHELFKSEIMDETGYMEEEEIVLAETPDGRLISFTQKDVRQLQLAKSAIRAGAETLLLRYGITAAEVDTVYLAGGFGYHINLEKAMGIGLLPEGFRGKIKVLGNGSLQGALQYDGEALTTETAKRIVEVSEEIGLAADKDFNELYMEYMAF